MLQDKIIVKRARGNTGVASRGSGVENLEADHASNISTIAGVSHETPATSGRRLEHKGLNTGRRLVPLLHWNVVREQLADKVPFRNIAKVRTR